MSKATFDTNGLTGSFSKDNMNNQFAALFQGDKSPLRPRARSTPNMAVDVASAIAESFYTLWLTSTLTATYAGGTSTAISAPSANPRIDLLYLNISNVLTWITGTEAAVPSIPVFTGSGIPIALVYAKTTMATIVNYEDKDANPNEGYIYRDIRTPYIAAPTKLFSSMFKDFKGDASDGSITLSANQAITDATDMPAGGAANTPYFVQCVDFDDNGKTLTVDTGWLFLGCTGRCTISGTITSIGYGNIGGGGFNAGSLGNYGGRGANAFGRGGQAVRQASSSVGVPYTVDSDIIVTSSSIARHSQVPVDIAFVGAGGGGGATNSTYDGGCGGGAGSFGGVGGDFSEAQKAGLPAVATSSIKSAMFNGGGASSLLILMSVRGAGGGGGGGGAGGGGNGGAGGGVIYIECNELVLTGTVTSNGADPDAQVSPSDGAGGGGGGGIIIIRANTIITDIGTKTADGGTNATSSGGGEDGGDGAAGLVEVGEVE